ncbi:type I restriction enzyme HsdR N-terminal domain-containing protein [Psychroflexus aestuariivivens]|uniref:type I restriction enzyme HsdR N-terminal domain-containing protein n=1 Tax=Psychroflexus aestuariivivens TaxID=1795040 RepID=UPI000FDC2E13|nr:type I restriction enzyme HsdR N-terminal domain-containing protein [Psychroflexus aestuariivivens]
MKSLNFPEYEFRFKSKENKTAIFSILRKKFLILTPEEWVRQHCVNFLISEKNYSKSLLNEEKQIKLNGIDKRYDIVAFKPDGNIRLVVECKAPNVKITQDTFDQIARYNMALNAEYLMVTNGLFHYYCKLDYDKKKYDFLPELPILKKK